MNTIINLIIWIIFFGLIGCEKEADVKFHIDYIDSDKYYSREIIPTDYQKIYGKWKL